MRQRRCTSTSQKSAHMRRTEWFIYVAILFLLLACLPFWLLHLRPAQSRALTNPPAQSLYWIEADLAERPQGAVEEVNRRVMTYDCSDGAPRTFAGLDDASNGPLFKPIRRAFFYANKRRAKQPFPLFRWMITAGCVHVCRCRRRIPSNGFWPCAAICFSLFWP